ncbi:MAG: VPLPA-CTERM sorting domain-containing protein [Pseudomonadota bacterium]
MNRVIAAALAASVFVAPAFASTMTIVSESTAPMGDYADLLGASTNQLGSIPAGIATLSGNLTAPNDNIDALFLTIDAQTELVSASITTTGGIASMFATLLDSAGITVFEEFFDANGTVDLLTLADTPLQEGTYNFAVGFISFEAGDPPAVSWTTNSVINEIPASPVPLPAGLPLLLAGLGGLYALRRRRASH